MNKSLNRTLNLVQKSDSMHEWTLQESVDGEIEDTEYIPWDLSLNFNAKNFSYAYSSERELDAEIDDEEEDFYNNTYETITVQLDFDTRDSSYLPISFFGTKRQISDFGLTIHKRQKEHEESGEACYVWGIPEYEYELDFKKYEVEDTFGIDLYMEEKRFDELKSLVISKSLASLRIRLSRVRGVYAPWTPLVTPDELKILTGDIKIESKDEKFKEKLGDAIKPIHTVNKWSISWSTKQELVFPKSEDEDDEDWLDLADDEDNLQESIETKEEYLLDKTNRQLQQITKLIPRAIKFGYGVLILLALIAYSLLA